MNIKQNDRLFFTIFPTRWGLFGLAGSQSAIFKTILPLPSKKTVKKLIALGLKNPKFHKNFEKDLQHKIQSFFEGRFVDFSNVPVYIDYFSQFTRMVLNECRNLSLAEITTYNQLAENIGCPGAARAVGTALAKNPLPLIIPCHRIIRSDGSLGGFTARGGTKLKSKLIQHELAISSKTIIQYA